MSTLGAVGRPIPRIDAAELVSGQARFSLDVSAPNALVGAVLRSPHPHARIVDIDVSGAWQVPGVKAVLTGRNTPQIRYGLTIQDEAPLALDRVRYVGDEVAAVAATTHAAARAALSGIRVTYEVLPAVLTPTAAMAPEAMALHSEYPDNVAVRAVVQRGDFAAALATADKVLSRRFTTSGQHHGYLEPVSCTVAPGAGGGLTLWGPVQDPFYTRASLARVLDMPHSRVRVIQTHIGGSYGSKLFHTRLFYLGALLARAAGGPVRLVQSLQDELAAGRPRIPATIEITVAAKNDGTLVGKRVRVVADNGAYASYAPGPVNVMATRADALYKIPHLDTEAVLVYTNKVPTGAMRGFGNITMFFAVESLLDELARELDMDPLALRMKNAVQTGETTALGWEIHSSGLGECVDLVRAEVAGWQAEPAPMLPQGLRRGIGLACGLHVSSNRVRAFDGSTAVVKLNEDGTAAVLTGEADVGQGLRTAYAQIAAEVLGIDPQSIEVPLTDTAYSPFCLGVYADRGTTIGGNAVKRAAEAARAQVLGQAAELLGVPAESLTLADGWVRTQPGARAQAGASATAGLPLAEVCRQAIWHAGGAPIMGVATFDPDTRSLNPANGYEGNPSTGYTFACLAAEVEVDTATGAVRVLRIVTANDVGRAINPLLVDGQIQGAVAQGLGFALMERMAFQDGRVVSHEAGNRVPGVSDVPPIQVFQVESIEPTGPFGAKGVGQTGTLMVAPAVANAIAEATGVRLTDLPMTSERLWTELAKG